MSCRKGCWKFIYHHNYFVFIGLDISHVVPSAKNSNVEELDYFTIKELSINRGFIERYRHLLVEREDEFGKVEILYFTEKGYQRKGMNLKFYTDFENDKLYFDLPTVLMAYQYLKADHINSLEELQLNFKKNFIENFVEGESIFFASW